MQRPIEAPLSEEVHFARSGEEAKEPVAAPKRSKKEPEIPAGDEETAETA